MDTKKFVDLRILGQYAAQSCDITHILLHIADFFMDFLAFRNYWEIQRKSLNIIKQ